MKTLFVLATALLLTAPKAFAEAPKDHKVHIRIMDALRERSHRNLVIVVRAERPGDTGYGSVLDYLDLSEENTRQILLRDQGLGKRLVELAEKTKADENYSAQMDLSKEELEAIEKTVYAAASDAKTQKFFQLIASVRDRNGQPSAPHFRWFEGSFFPPPTDAMMKAIEKENPKVFELLQRMALVAKNNSNGEHSIPLTRKELGEIQKALAQAKVATTTAENINPILYEWAGLRCLAKLGVPMDAVAQPKELVSFGMLSDLSIDNGLGQMDDESVIEPYPGNYRRLRQMNYDSQFAKECLAAIRGHGKIEDLTYQHSMLERPAAAKAAGFEYNGPLPAESPAGRAAQAK